MWTFWKDKKNWNLRVWNIKKISYISILIATSVSFVLIFSNIIPIAALPTFKLTLAGLPIKITGYIFGPLIGIITGILTDLISFSLRPTFIHYWYTLAFAFAGLIPGVIAYLFNRSWKKEFDQETFFKSKYINSNFFITLGILFGIILFLILFVIIKGDSIFQTQKLINNKWIFLAIAITGFLTMFVSLFLFRITFKPFTFNVIVTIVAFSAILELINTLLVTLGDIQVWGYDKGELISVYIAHMLLSPFKIWVNLFVIYVAYKIVSPLIYNKNNNGW